MNGGGAERHKLMDYSEGICIFLCEKLKGNKYTLSMGTFPPPLIPSCIIHPKKIAQT